jgi:hypothetical protein
MIDLIKHLLFEWQHYPLFGSSSNSDRCSSSRAEAIAK